MQLSFACSTLKTDAFEVVGTAASVWAISALFAGVVGSLKGRPHFLQNFAVDGLVV